MGKHKKSLKTALAIETGLSWLPQTSKEDYMVLFCKGFRSSLCSKSTCSPPEFETQAKFSFYPLPSCHMIFHL